ncbi:CoxG family protein [Sporosarcina sp. G11-34]|uniref:CoxG family protein n=1 Tax=Sporosarcina sp. G11-34 TaxID=2849605 RepID=UPI0022A904E6|nr:SRPBCC domain-containing protein [Sporosarcina sp. G11-34]
MEHSYIFKGISREVLWKTIQDKEVLQKSLPGCKVFDEVEENVFHAVLAINIGPIKGEFTADVQQVDMKEPEFYRLLVHVKGKPGDIEAIAEMNMVDTEKGAVLTCNADLEVTGLLASIGQRIMGGVAKVVIGQFFKDIEKETQKVAEF